MTQRTDKDRLIRRILRVDHAGEHGAVSIYTAQIKHLRGREVELEPWLKETLSHEQDHRRKFREAMPERSAKPCRALSIWSIGGAVLGTVTAVMGRTAVLACTAAVERTVHDHLLDQIAFLREHDAALAVTVAAILEEEAAHLAYAEAALNQRNNWRHVLEPMIAVATEVMIAISTRGDSLRLKRDLAQLQV